MTTKCFVVLSCIKNAKISDKSSVNLVPRSMENLIFALQFTYTTSKISSIHFRFKMTCHYHHHHVHLNFTGTQEPNYVPQLQTVYKELMLQPTDTLSNIQASHWYHSSQGDHLHSEIIFSNFTIWNRGWSMFLASINGSSTLLDQFTSPDIRKDTNNLSSENYNNNSDVGREGKLEFIVGILVDLGKKKGRKRYNHGSQPGSWFHRLIRFNYRD